MMVWSKYVLATVLGAGLALSVASISRADYGTSSGTLPHLTPPAQNMQPAPRYNLERIRHAIHALRDTRVDVDAIEPHFHGHRVEALRAIDKAIGELQACLDEVGRR